MDKHQPSPHTWSPLRSSVNRRSAVSAIACTFATLSWCGKTQASQFPTKVVSLKVGYPAGGPADFVSRALQLPLQRQWGQPVIVENVAGAGGSIGVQRVLNSAADGYSLYFGTASDVVLAPLTIPTARYKPEDLRLLACAGTTDLVLVTRPDLGIATLDQLASRLGDRTKQELTFASFGSGSLFHLVAEDLNSRIRGRMLQVPFSGMGPTVTNLIGGQVDLALLPVVGPTIGLINEGRVKPIAVTGMRRHAQLPMVPTADESGVVKDFQHNVWLGVFASRRLSEDLATRINASANIALQDAHYVKLVAETGSTIPQPGLDLEQCSDFYAKETEKLRRLARLVPAEKR